MSRSIQCHHYNISGQKSSKLSMKSYVLEFPLSHYLSNLSSIPIPNATYQILRQSIHWFERRIVKVFTMNRHGSHAGHVTWTIRTNFSYLSPRRLYMKFCDTWPNGLWGDFCNYTMRVLGLRSNNDLNILFSQIFMYSLRQI